MGQAFLVVAMGGELLSPKESLDRTRDASLGQQGLEVRVTATATATCCLCTITCGGQSFGELDSSRDPHARPSAAGGPAQNGFGIRHVEVRYVQCVRRGLVLHVPSVGVQTE